MFKRAKKSELDIIKQFYKDALKLIRKTKIDSLISTSEFELLPYITALYQLAFISYIKEQSSNFNFQKALLQASHIAFMRTSKHFMNPPFENSYFENDELLFDRSSFYDDVIYNKELRSYCFFGETPTEIFSRCQTAFIDLMLHPLSSEDYDNSPYMIFDFFEMTKIATRLFPRLLKLSKRLYADIYDCLDRKAS